MRAKVYKPGLWFSPNCRAQHGIFGFFVSGQWKNREILDVSITRTSRGNNCTLAPHPSARHWLHLAKRMDTGVISSAAISVYTYRRCPFVMTWEDIISPPFKSKMWLCGTLCPLTKPEKYTMNLWGVFDSSLYLYTISSARNRLKPIRSVMIYASTWYG